MDANEIKEYTSGCFRGEPPLCADSCPLQLDVRGLVDKVAKGDFNAAYRLYRSRAIFPGIVSRVCHEPCKAGCARAGLEPPLDLAGLERAVVAHASNKEPIKYNLPQRKLRIAVIGAGLSGLACALRLAAKKYTVTLYDRREFAGGRLWDTLPAGDFLPEISAQFAPEKVEWHFSTELTSLDALEADAVYVATGAGGASFGLDMAGKSEPFFDGGRTFAGGGLIGALPVEALAHGARAAQAIEFFLKSGGVSWERREPTRMLPLCKESWPNTAIVVAEPEDGYTPEQAALEAGRCLRCDCGRCYAACDLMQHYNKYPLKIGDEVYASLNAVDLYTHRVNTRFISSCNLCGLCGEACPTGVDTGGLMQKSRDEMHRQGVLPPAFHDYWLRDMAHAGSAEAALFLPPEPAGGSGGAEYLFFPGCQLGASSPETVLAAYARLRELHPGMGIFLECCGAPALWAGDVGGFKAHLAALEERVKGLGSPALAVACPSCLRLFKENLPGLKARSLYEILAESPPVPAADRPVDRPVDRPFPPRSSESSPEACVFDPCSSRAFPGMAAQVRQLAAARGVVLGKPPYKPEEARCCGWGGHIYPANPEYARKLAQTRVAASPLPYITYCSNCRDSFAAAGKPSIHLLDLLFRPEAGYAAAPPGLSQRRKNRRSLKLRLSGQGAPCPGGEESMKTALYFSPELAAQMDKDLLLEDDIRQTVEHCERSGRKVLDGVDGSFTGHLRLGVITCWVRYRPENEGFRVLKAYSHRMQIVEEE